MSITETEQNTGKGKWVKIPIDNRRSTIVQVNEHARLAEEGGGKSNRF